MRTLILIWFVFCVVSTAARFGLLMFNQYPRQPSSIKAWQDVLGVIIGLPLCAYMAYLLWIKP